MATLEDLLKMNGVVAAGEFTADGKLVDYKAKMEMSREMAAMTAQFCATVTMMFNTLAGAYAQLSKMNWLPPERLDVRWRQLHSGYRGQPRSLRRDSQGRLQQVVRGPRRPSVT